MTLLASPAMAYVTPKMGGGQQNASMVMPNVQFDGTNLSITGLLDMMGMPISDVPVMRPLTAPDAFDPTKLYYSALNGKAYNSQYGWNMDATHSASLPSGADIWIEELDASPGLKTYEANTYTPIFGTDSSSTKYQWGGIMLHNSYVVEPQIANWSAHYKLYLGDSSGDAIAGYGAAEITLNWASVPEPSAMGLLGLGGLMLMRRRRV